jgi:S1-C subfamily serine protease
MKLRRFSPEPIMRLDRAAKQGDSKEIAFNLVSMLSSAPPTFLRTNAGKEALEDARLLGSKYAISAGEARGGKMYIVGLHEQSVAEHGRHSLWSGSGFILDGTGLILTNRHVAKDAKSLMIMLHGAQGKPMSAEVVVIDDEQDLALIRLREVPADMKLPIVQLAPGDMPADGAECTVIGYPMVDRLGGSPKITHGIVSSSLPSVSKSKSAGLLGRGSDDFDVYIDAKVNPGNSGGPILDRFGNVMAIVCMKSLSSEIEDSYGMGISAGRIRRFLAKNHVNVEKGTKGSAGLSVEDIAAKVEPATVLIVATGK